MSHVQTFRDAKSLGLAIEQATALGFAVTVETQDYVDPDMANDMLLRGTWRLYVLSMSEPRPVETPRETKTEVSA